MNPTDSRKRERFERLLARLVDRYAEDVGYPEAELLLQQHAQDMRELSEPDVTAADLDGWSR